MEASDKDNELVRPTSSSSFTIAKDSELVRPTSSFFTIFQYADTKDVALMSLGFVGCVGDGIALPTMMLLMIRVFDAFGNASIHTSSSNPTLVDEIRKVYRSNLHRLMQTFINLIPNTHKGFLINAISQGRLLICA